MDTFPVFVLSMESLITLFEAAAMVNLLVARKKGVLFLRAKGYPCAPKTMGRDSIEFESLDWKSSDMIG